MMGHGKHDNCAMCRMGKAVGMIEKHPEGCECETHPKKKDERENYGK
ncbi:MAG: hypothetical protein HYT07_01310 [Candidatus Levybacteria bacterium]|nr:hypothetical protein [Candidatus Levybacteria bacterium]